MAAITAAVVGAGAAVAGVANASRARKDAKKAQAQQKEAADRQAAIAERQQEMAEEQYQRYKTTFQPLEDQYVAESANYGSIANQNKKAKEAASLVRGNFATAREQLSRTPGINTNSQAYLQEANRLNLAEAAASAATQNKAREDTVAKGRAYATDALSLGKGLPANAASSLNAAGSAYSSIGSTFGNLASGARASAADSINGIGTIGRAVGGLYQSGALDKIGSTVGGWLGSTNSNTPAMIDTNTTVIPDTMFA